MHTPGHKYTNISVQQWGHRNGYSKQVEASGVASQPEAHSLISNQIQDGSAMAGFLISWSAAVRVQGGESVKKYTADLVYFLWRSHQPAGGKSRSGGAAIAPVNQHV